MIFTVVWARSAEMRLAELHNNAGPDRQAVADASNTIDRELRTDPARKGYPYGNYYLYSVSPLAVMFEINPDDRLVRVVAVRRDT